MKTWTFFLNKSSPNCSNEHVESSFDNRVKKLTTKRRKSFRYSPKQKKTFPQKRKPPLRFPTDTQKAVLTTMLQKTLTKMRKKFAFCPKNLKKSILLRNIHLLKTFHWTLRMQFWQPSQKNFVRTPENFSYNSKKTNKCKSLKKLSWKRFTGHVKCVCDNHVEEFIN